MKHGCPLSYGFNGLFGFHLEIRPRSTAFFRPEEIHPRSCEGPARLTPLIHGCAGIADSLIGADFENIRVSHSYTDTVSTLKTTAIDCDFLSREEMAHGHCFETSLTIPFLNAFYTDEMMVRLTGEWRPRCNVVGIRGYPRERKGALSCGVPNNLSCFLRHYTQSLSYFRIVRCSAGFNEMAQNILMNHLSFL